MKLAAQEESKSEKPAPETRSRLGRVIRGVVQKPPRIVVYGTSGIGKTTFAADAPNPIFLGAEDGTAQLDVARFPEPHNWADVLESVDGLEHEKHDFKTLVIDTADWLEPLSMEAVMEEHKDDDLSYGRDTAFMVNDWRKLLASFDRLRDQGMIVIVLAHSHVKSYNNPGGDDYDRYQMKVAPKLAALLNEWPDAVLFADYETLTKKEKGKKTKGIRGTARFLHTERTAAYDAKNRFGLPARIPLNWAEFEDNREATSEQITEALARIEALLVEASEKIKTKAAEYLKLAGKNAHKLAQLENWIEAKETK